MEFSISLKDISTCGQEELGIEWKTETYAKNTESDEIRFLGSTGDRNKKRLIKRSCVKAYGQVVSVSHLSTDFSTTLLLGLRLEEYNMRGKTGELGGYKKSVAMR